MLVVAGPRDIAMKKKNIAGRGTILTIVLLCSTGLFCAPGHTAALPTHEVAITFDDLPYVMRAGASQRESQNDALAANNAILATLRRDAIPVTAFVNEDKVQALGAVGTDILGQWNQGTLELGNHAAHHIDSNDLTPAQFETEIREGERSIGPLTQKAGRYLEFFRFPFNHVGDTEAKRVALSGIVKRLGYRQAATTIDVEDYLFNEAYECAHAAHRPDDETRISQAYVAYAYRDSVLSGPR